jgi:NAD(P)-dependent dehydrogenase (short-subunit alcohol dehydrogenase family)
LTNALRVEVAGDGVRVILIEPGGFKTGIWEEFERDIAKRDEEGSRFVAAYQRSLQMQRLFEPLMGSPEKCAKVIADALSARHPRARYLIGIDAQAANLAYSLAPTFVRDRVYRLSLGL